MDLPPKPSPLLPKPNTPPPQVGFREWIFSDVTGTLGAFAASSEFAFSTIVQRVLDSPGKVRMHYGHPDLFNKLHIMTRVGWVGVWGCGGVGAVRQDTGGGGGPN